MFRELFSSGALRYHSSPYHFWRRAPMPSTLYVSALYSDIARGAVYIANAGCVVATVRTLPPLRGDPGIRMASDGGTMDQLVLGTAREVA